MTIELSAILVILLTIIVCVGAVIIAKSVAYIIDEYSAYQDIKYNGAKSCSAINIMIMSSIPEYVNHKDTKKFMSKKQALKCVKSWHDEYFDEKTKHNYEKYVDIRLAKHVYITNFGYETRVFQVAHDDIMSVECIKKLQTFIKTIEDKEYENSWNSLHI